MSDPIQVENGSGLEVRTNFNKAILAVAQFCAGAAEPSPTYAYQWWADTGNNLMKQRNAANDAWVGKGKLLTDGTVEFYADAIDWSRQLDGAIRYKKGTAIASASSLDLTGATGNIVHVTGSTQINSIVISEGQVLIVIFDAAPLIKNGSSIVTHTGADVQAAAGDTCVIVGDAANVAKITAYTKAGFVPAPLPTSLTAIQINAANNVNLTAPAGGTWKCLVFVFAVTGGGHYSYYYNLYAGGALIHTAIPGYYCVGIADKVA